MHWTFSKPLGWLAFTVSLSLPAATYQVAQSNPQASDAGDGSPEHPWKTIAQAAGQVRSGDTVIIGDGVYRETVNVKTAGTMASPIIFVAAPGAAP